jgi:glutaredoxin
MTLLVVALTLGIASLTARPRTGPPQVPDIEVFVQAGCPHCARAKEFLADLRRERPDLSVVERDVSSDPAARLRLLELATARGVQQLGVPAFYLRGVLLIGFADSQTTGRAIRTLLVAAGRPPPPHGETGFTPVTPDVIDTPVLGRLSASKLGLPAFTLLVGLVDGFNPCAMWALLYILSLLVNLQSRTRMLAIGGTFVLVAGVLYYAFMAAWLEFFLLVGFSRFIQAGLGTLAVFVGAVNLKDFVAFRRGLSLSIPEAAKQPLYARMRRVLTAENLMGALGAVAVLSTLVNLVELLCTAGLPAVYTQILSSRQLPRWSYHAYLGLYTAAYVLDDSLVLGIATVTLSRRKLQERGGRWLKLLSGTVMLILGAALLFRPEWVS